MSPDLERLEVHLDYTFRDRELLLRALTHPSYLQDHPEVAESNQRFEFLGDAVLQLVLTEALFDLFPDDREGNLSKRRSALANGVFLARIAKELGLDSCLLLGASEETTGGRDRASSLEDAFEALIGAIYLDGGLPAAMRVVRLLYGDLTARLSIVEDVGNPKGRLQERVQPIHGNNAVRYEVVRVEGQDHAREYEVAVFLQERPLGTGRGSSKKAAEEAAARAGLATLAAEDGT